MIKNIGHNARLRGNDHGTCSTTRLPVTGIVRFEKERTGVFALSTISTLSLSLLFLPCYKFPPLFPQPCLSKTTIFLACELSGKERRHYILLPIRCYYAQYRMRSAILRNHLNRISHVYILVFQSNTCRSP